MSNAQPAQTSAPSLPIGERFLSLREVEFRTSLKRSTLYALPEFPRPVKITVRRSAWLASQVDAWIDSRVRAGGVA